jgi:hypothetical protein
LWQIWSLLLVSYKQRGTFINIPPKINGMVFRDQTLSTNRMVVDFFTSRSFCQILQIAANTTKDISSETGFAIAQVVGEEGLYYGEVVKGSTTRPIEDENNSIDGHIQRSLENEANLLSVMREYPEYASSEVMSALNYNRIVPMVNLHTHPQDSISPSQEDLEIFLNVRDDCFNPIDNGAYRVNYRPISLICSISDTNPKGYDVLVFQETGDRPLSDPVSFRIYEALNQACKDHGESNEDVVRLLNMQEGVQATLLHYQQRGKKLVLDPNNIDQLKGFNVKVKLLGEVEKKLVDFRDKDFRRYLGQDDEPNRDEW